MKRLTNIMQKQLLLASMLLLYFTSTSYSQSNYLPRFLYDDYTINPTNNAEVWLANTVQMAIEESLASNNHRFIAMRANSASAGGQLRFDDRMVRFYDGESIYDGGITLSSELFKCYDSNIPTVYLCRYSNGMVYATYNTFASLSVGYNNVLNMGKNFTILVLPMLSSVSSGFYSDEACKNAVTEVVEGEKVYFKAIGDGEEIVASYTDDVEGTIKLEHKSNNVHEFTAKLQSSLSYEENQDIYVFSRVKGSNGDTYYSSNYKKLSLKVKPVIHFVNAFEVGGKLYITDDNSDPIKVKNISKYNVLKVNNTQCTSGSTCKININNGEVEVKTQLQVNNNSSIDHIKTYKIERLLKWVEDTTNCSFKLTKPPLLPEGVKSCPIVSYDDGQGHGNGGMSQFPYTNSNRYKYTYYVRYTYKDRSIDSKTYIRSFLPLKMSTTAKNIVGCESNNQTAGTIEVTIDGGSGKYNYFVDNVQKTTNSTEKTYTFNPTTAKGYTIKVTDSYGCSTSDKTVTIGIDKKFDFVSKYPESKNFTGCTAAGDAKITTQITGGTGQYDYYVNGVKTTKSATTYEYTPTEAKEYVIKVTDSKGCFTSDKTVTIAIDNEFSATFNPEEEIGCANADGYVGKVTVEGKSGTGPYQFSTDGKNFVKEIVNGQAQTKKVYSFDKKTTQTYYIKDDKGCKANSGETPITIDIKNKFDFVSDHPKSQNFTGCVAAGGAKITTQITGGTGQYDYYVNGVKTTKSATTYEYTPTDTTSYEIKVTDSKGCSTDEKTVKIGIDKNFDFASDYPKSQNFTGCVAAGGAKITTQITGGTGQYDYYVNGVKTTKSATTYEYTPTDTTSYEIKVTDSKGCSTKAKTVPIGINNPISVTITPTPATCYGANGKIEVTSPVNFIPNKYEYRESGTSKYKVNSSAVFNLPGGKKYDIKVSDNSCAYESDSKTPIEIKQPSKIEASYQYDPIQCNDYFTTVTAYNITGGNGNKYEIFSNKNYSHPQNGNKLQLTGVKAGEQIAFYVQDSLDCKSADSKLDIEQPAPITVGITSQVDADCKGEDNGSVTVSASGGAGGYTYYLEDEKYNKDKSENGEFINKLSPGKYSLTVIDKNKCVFPKAGETKIIEIGNKNLLKLPTPTITPVLCHGAETGSISLDPSFEKDGFNGKFKYWLNGEEKNSNLFEGLAASKNYEVKVQPDGSDCYVVLKNVEVGAPTTEQLTYTVKPVNFTTTKSSDARIDVTPSGGWGGHTVIVKDNNGAIVTSNADLQPGKYTVTVTDAEGCIANDNKEYTIARPETDLKLNVVEHKDVKCNGQSTGKIKVIATGGWGNYSYTLSPNKGKTRDSADYRIFENLPSLSGNTYKVKVEDKMGVTHDTTITIKQYDQLSASSKVTKEISCPDGDDELITVTITGGKGGYTLSLDGNTYYNESGKIEITGKKKGVYKYTVVDANQCVSPEFTIDVKDPDPIKIEANASNIYNNCNIRCNGGTDTVIVSATGGNGQYKFSIGGEGQTSAQYVEGSSYKFSGVKAGPLTITVIDKNNCTATRNDFQLSQPETPVTIIDTATTQPKCYGYDGKITVKVAGGIVTQNYNYKLNTAEVVSDGPQHTFENIKARDDHKLVVTDANGCEVEMNDIELSQPNKLDVSVSNVKNNLCNGDELGIITFEIHGGTAPYDYSLNGKDKVAFGNDTKITGLPAKDKHSIVVSDANGCKFETIEQEITEEDKITAQTVLNDYNGYNISCFGDADTARIEISGGVGNYRTTLDDRTLAGNDVKFDGLTEGSYSYKVIDGNNCSETFDFVMTEPANLSFVFVDSTDVKCYNKNNGKLLAVIKGGVANYVYDVTSASGASINKKTTNSTEYSYNSIAAGKYMLNVTDANNCVISQSYTIGQPDPLTVSVNKLKDVDCKGAETGAVSATAKGGIGAYSYSWNKGMTGHIAQNLPAGEYSVLVTDANNCQSEVDENGVKAQTTIDEPAAALTMLDPLYTNPTCSYNEDGIITINVSGGWGGYKYALNGVSYGSNSIEGLNEGTYTAKVTDAKGCEVSTNTITLKKPKALSFESSVGTIICNGGTTEVTITSASGGTEGNYSYSIDGEKTWQSGTTFTGVTKGNYTLKMKDGNECTTEHAVNVTEPDKLVLKEDVWHNYNGTTRKANGKITVTPQGGVMPYSYQWKDTTVTSQVLDNIGFGLYTIIVTDKLGCVETNTYYINDNNPTPEVVDAICPEGTDGSIRFGETVECTRVEWYNARTEEQLMQSDTKTITGLPKGIYKAKLFNNSQVTYIYAEVKAPDSLEYVQNQTDIDCHGDDSGKASVSITGGVAPVSVIWKNQKGEEISRNQTIENLITGKYTAYISDAQNCQSSSKTLVFDITEPADAFVLDENTHNNVKCYGNNDGVVVLRTSGNQGDVTYFQNGAAIPSNEAKSLYAGDYAFYAVDDKNCKTQTMNVVVSQPNPLSSSVKTIMPIKCATETGSVEVEAEGGTTPYSYKVLEQNDFRLSPIFDGLTTDDYKFVVKDVNNCYDTASYLLTEPEQLVITGNQLKDEYCGHSDGSISIEIAGGTGGYDTRWSDYQTGESASDLAAGSYQVSVFDENGCLATETYEIKNIPAPVVSIRNIDSTKCYGSADGVAQLNVSLGTGAISYLWATDTTDVPYSGKLKAGLQSVVAVDELGCADTTQFTMPQPDSMKIVIAVQNPLCFNDNSGKLTASVSNFKTGLSYKWDNGVDGNENADLYAGTYGVSVTNANGCIAKKNATLVYPAKITIKKVAIDDTKCDLPNGSVSVSATGGTGILKFGVNPENMAAANKIEGLQSGNHKLMVIDENQCSIDTTIFVGATVPPVLVINTRDDVKCHGDANGKVSVGVEGGRMPFVYSWDNGDRTTMSTKNGLGVGSHKAYVYDGFGCSDTLDFAIDEPYMLEIYESSSSDPVCYGYSNGQIVAGVMGGTAPYTYQWGDKQNTAKATGLAAGSHYLNVTDKNGCKAKKYFSLTNPLPVVVDIPDVIDICSNQTADIDAGYEGSFHYWSSANGFESVAQNISVNKKGTYVVTVTTLDGCIGTDSTFVNVSDKEINSNFLLQSDAYVGDTIVMIEISWPLPESIEWSCPEGMTIISDAGDEIEIVADKEGVYDIGLTTYNDICTEQTFKSIVVNPRAQKPKQMLQAAPKIIKSVNVYPSPTTGPFNLEIELNEEHDVSIEVVHISGKLQTVRHMKGDRNYVLNFSNAELNAGIHTISVSAGAEKVTKKVVIVK